MKRVLVRNGCWGPSESGTSELSHCRAGRLGHSSTMSYHQLLTITRASSLRRVASATCSGCAAAAGQEARRWREPKADRETVCSSL